MSNVSETDVKKEKKEEPKEGGKKGGDEKCVKATDEECDEGEDCYTDDKCSDKFKKGADGDEKCVKATQEECDEGEDCYTDEKCSDKFKGGEEGEGDEKGDGPDGTFNNKALEATTKTVNKVNFSNSRKLADKYADQLVDSAARYGETITIDTIKEKLGSDLFRNLKQTSLKYFFDFVSKYSNTSIDMINDVFKGASIDLEEDGLAGILDKKNRMRGNILLIFLLDRLNFALTNQKTKSQLVETIELLNKFANETFMAVIVTLKENKKLLEETMENFRPIIKNFIVTAISAALQGIMVGVATAGPIGAPANLWFQGSKVINEIAPKLGNFSENVGNIIDKYDKMLAGLSEKGEGPLKRFKDIKMKITGFNDMLSSIQKDAALIDAMGKAV